MKGTGRTLSDMLDLEMGSSVAWICLAALMNFPCACGRALFRPNSGARLLAGRNERAPTADPLFLFLSSHAVRPLLVSLSSFASRDVHRVQRFACEVPNAGNEVVFFRILAGLSFLPGLSSPYQLQRLKNVCFINVRNFLTRFPSDIIPFSMWRLPCSVACLASESLLTIFPIINSKWHASSETPA